MTAPEEICKLIEHFEQNREALRSGKYNEAQLRQEFLNPFFTALGWDMFNEQQFGEAYKEVIHETSVEVEGAAKAPDYAFRIGGVTKFFVEAKKPSVNIEHAIHPAYQVKRYAWSAKLPLAILSDFEEFAVYDCRSKPNPGDQAATGRVMYLTYRDYIEKWDEIAAIFSKNAIQKGAFDQYAQGVKGKRGTKEVDDAFLEEMEGWRETLARNLAIRNPELENVRQLNYAVQMTIDRIVFLRICEDRGIEKEGQLKELTLESGIYANLCGLFRTADKRYNSGLFHFEKEKDQSSHPDDLTPRLKVDDKVLKEIICDLYYPSPYVFKLIPADILGQVYERFLGKVIRLTAGHQAKVEEKPEVRKAGGVYYTPTYIVEYIVKNTVGKLLEGKTPAEAGALKIVDPACGSGSFLLGAFQYLIDWHCKYYQEHDPEKWAKGSSPAVYRGQGGEWQLTTREKKRILLNNLHGVDIDPQAVEVTKLSLLLKVLEEESGQLSLGFERALPDLGMNIQCGNSLIGPDYYDDRQLSMDFMDEEERQRVNAFDWQTAFPQVFAKGGFDAVIGNPPYIRIQTIESKDIRYLTEKYRTAVGNYDIYCPFLEKAVNIISEHGYSSFILPHRFFKTDYGVGLRKYLSQKELVSTIIDFDGYMVFNNASINTCVIILTKEKHLTYKFAQIRFLKRSENEMYDVLEKIDENSKVNNTDLIIDALQLKQLKDKPWIFVFEWEKSLWDKLTLIPQSLGDISEQIFQGLKTGADLIYSVQVKRLQDKYSIIKSNTDNLEYEIESSILHKQIKGGDINRYQINETNRAVIFPYKNGKLIDEKTMQKNFPKTWLYFLNHKKYLIERENGKMKGFSWYGYTRNQALSSMEQPKILIPDYYAYASYCFDLKGEYYFFGGGAGGYGIVQNTLNYHYILGLLNSKLLDWYLRKISVRQYQTAFSYVKKYIEQIPIYPINLSNPADKSIHDRILFLVEHIQELNKQTARTPQENESLQREVEITEKKIDVLVYELYELTKEEIRIIENKF
jgi:type I restriction-modification system DNA methylase subunit